MFDIDHLAGKIGSDSDDGEKMIDLRLDILHSTLFLELR